jgi:hypothetical protein
MLEKVIWGIDLATKALAKFIDHHNVRVTLLQGDQCPSTIRRCGHLSAELARSCRKPSNAPHLLIVETVVIDRIEFPPVSEIEDA